jgi:restriction system protein
MRRSTAGPREAVLMTRRSLADVAEEILLGHSKGAPMHYRRLTEIGIDAGLITPGGLTPEASVNAAITQDIRRRAASSAPQRFRSQGRGFFSLAQPTDLLHGALEERNLEVRRRLRDVLGETHPQQFEVLIGELLIAIGFEDVEVTRYVGDRGIDLRATLAVGGVTDVKTAIQVKRLTSGSIGAPTVRELRGGLGPHERGLIITLSTFSKDARREAMEPDRSPISLVDGDELIELLIGNQIGVISKPLTVLELDEGYFTHGDESEAVDIDAEKQGPETFRRVLSPPHPGKVLSLWPLPGGGSAWKATLDSMLKFVASEAPTMQSAIDWLISQFDRVESKKTARSYWQVLRSFGLVETQGELLTVTALGSEYLDDPTSDHLLEIANLRIVGIREMLSWLAEAPLTMEELLARFREDLGVEWESTAQIQYRLGWLVNLGSIAHANGLWERVGV